MRKQNMEAFDQKRVNSLRLTELDQETKAKTTYLLAKAQSQIEEQEDDIKHMNELLLYAKCVAIRDNQVIEKQQIAKLRKDEEMRMDQFMEAERRAEVLKIEERDVKRVLEMRKGAVKIREQITQRKEAALLEQEKKDHETRAIISRIKESAERDRKEKSEKIELQRKMTIEVT